jgi:PAS domain S-box-containing protein
VVHNAAIVVAVAIAVVSPTVFSIVGYLDVIDLRRFQAELIARQVATYAYVQGPTWRFSDHRVAELVRQIAPTADPGRQIISAVDGGIPIVVGKEQALPIARTSMPILVSSTNIGTVTVETSLRPLLFKIALAIVIGLILALAAYACVRFPLVRLNRAIDALRASEAQFRSLASAAPMAIAIKDLAGRFQWTNDEMSRRTGMTRDELIGKTTLDIHAKEIADEIVRLDRLVLATCEPQIAEVDVRSASGDTLPELNVRFPIVDEDGDVIGLGSAAVDISAQRAAENQLRQAQRLQAVGQLTGGIAHDFNNLLQVVEASLGLAKVIAPGESKLAELIDAALKAGRRGAELTRKLLAFSRQQLLRPERLDVDAWLQNETSLLARTLGEDVMVQATSCGHPVEIVVDEGNLTNAILNLAINARTAMPKGGTLTFSTSRKRFDAGIPIENDVLPAGDYVEIAVTDTGCGMTEEILSRAFEPFFTTKGVGEGSGLGLSMVYGFTRQSGGTVFIESEVGKGTTVRILLPAAEDHGNGVGEREET